MKIMLNKLPLKGTSSKNLETNRIVVRFMQEITKYGIIFARMILMGLTGETSNTSIVPLSFSLTIATEVIIAQIKININPIMPGTKL